MAAWKAQGLAGVHDDMGFVRTRTDRGFLVKGQLDIGRLDDGVNATDGLGVEGAAGLIDQPQVSGIFRAFEIFEPLAVDRELSGDGFHAVIGHAAGVPVVDVLRRRAEEFGKSGRRDVRYFEQRFKPWTASVFFFMGTSLRAYGEALNKRTVQNAREICDLM